MKKHIALAVQEKIQPLLDQNRDLFHRVPAFERDLRLEDADGNSDFFFEFRKDPTNANYIYWIKPKSSIDVGQDYGSTEPDGIIQRLKNWFEILRRYEKIPDDFETIYQKDYYSTFQIADEDADIAPLDDESQTRLYQYLDTVIEIVNLKQEGASEPKKKQLLQIVQECEKLQEEIPRLTKNQNIGKLARIWAKIKLAGLPLVKEALSEFRKAVYKEIFKQGLEVAPGVFDLLN